MKQEQNHNHITYTPPSCGGLIDESDKDGRLAFRSTIDEYEEEMKKKFGDKWDVEEINNKGLSEYLIGGAYTRILDIPKGVTIVSKLWKKERLWIIISGEVKIITERGEQNIAAPYIGRPVFGSKVALFAIKDTKWAAITGAETENIEEIENEIVAENYQDLSYPWELLEGDKK